MGFKQTATHRFGKGSYHQIGLVRGQFGNVPEAEWLQFIAQAGFDGWEEASWELDLRRCDSDEGAAAYARERVDMARKLGLEKGDALVVRVRGDGREYSMNLHVPRPLVAFSYRATVQTVLCANDSQLSP